MPTIRDAVGRLEMMLGMTGFDLPMWTIRRQIASAIGVVHVARRRADRAVMDFGDHREGEVMSMHDIFVFKQTGLDEQRRAQGYFQATGIRPQCLERLEAAGITLPLEMFKERVLDS